MDVRQILKGHSCKFASLSRTDLVLVSQNMIHREFNDPELARRELRTQDSTGIADVGHKQFLVDDDRGSGRAADPRLWATTCT